MEAEDFRRQAEEVVESYHIFDLELRDVLIDEYAQALKSLTKPEKPKLLLIKND